MIASLPPVSIAGVDSSPAGPELSGLEAVVGRMVWVLTLLIGPQLLIPGFLLATGKRCDVHLLPDLPNIPAC